VVSGFFVNFEQDERKSATKFRAKFRDDTTYFSGSTYVTLISVYPIKRYRNKKYA